MKRSQSVSKGGDDDQAKRYPKTFQPILENKIQRLYRQSSSISNPRFIIVPLVDKLNLIHAHRKKSFDKMFKVSPPTRLSRNQESSCSTFQSNPSTGRLRTATEKSLNRRERSKELLVQAEKIVKIEKENNQGIKKTANCYQKQIRINLKGINKRLSIEGLPGIELSRKLLSRKCSNFESKKKELNCISPYPVLHRNTLSTKN